MFDFLKMSDEKKLLLAEKNFISLRNINLNQLKKYSNQEITTLKISFTIQKIVLVLDAKFKLFCLIKKIKYKDISTNSFLYDIIGDYFMKVFEDKKNFPEYEEMLEHSELIILKLYNKIIEPENTFREKMNIHI